MEKVNEIDRIVKPINAELTPDKAEAAKHLTYIDPHATRFTFQTFDNDDTRKSRSLARIIHGSLEECWDELVNLNNQGAGVYVTINETDFKGRKDKNIVRVRGADLDLDGAPLGPVEAWDIKPAMILESSRGRYHVWFPLKDAPLEQFDSVQLALATKFDGDPAMSGLHRVTRLAGFIDARVKKVDEKIVRREPFVSRIIYANGALPLPFADFRAALPEVAVKPRSALMAADGKLKARPETVWTPGGEIEITTAFAQLNTLALNNLNLWAEDAFPGASLQGTGAYRVSSEDLGQGQYEEDLSIHPTGIWDFGSETPLSPVGAIMKFNEMSRDDAIAWLCDAGRLNFNWKAASLREAMACFDDELTLPYDPATAPVAPSWEDVTAYVPRRMEDVEPLEWLYGGHYVRRYLGCTIAPGASGKTMLVLTEALSMASGRDLIRGEIYPGGTLRVLYWSGEDPFVDIERRVVGTMHAHGLTAEDIRDRLFLVSGRDLKLRFLNADGSANNEAVQAITACMRRNMIDVVIFDPLIALHRGDENNNGLTEELCTVLRDMAEHDRCAVEVCHHVRKPGQSERASENTVDDARGASALNAASRNSRVLNKMTEKTGLSLGVTDFWNYFNVKDGKNNLKEGSGKPTWYRLVTQGLNNGRSYARASTVGVVNYWEPPKPTEMTDALREQVVTVFRETDDEGTWLYNRANSGALKNWAGKVIADVMGYDVSFKTGTDKERKDAKTHLEALIAGGYLEKRSVRTAHREDKVCVVAVEAKDGGW